MIKVCPNCHKTYSINFYTSDYVHKCNSGVTALDEDDVLKTGNYEDEVTIQETKVFNPHLLGGNKLKGTRGGIEGEKAYDVTNHGNKENLYRQRQHYEYIEV